MKKILIACVFLGVSMYATAQKMVTIRGTVTSDTKGFNKLYVYGNGVKDDSTQISNSKFSIKLPFEKPFMVLMYAEYTINTGGMYTPFGLLIDQPGTIDIEQIDLTKGMETGKIKGMESAVLYQQFSQGQEPLYRKINEELIARFGKFYTDERDPQFEALEKERTTLSRKYIGKYLEDFVIKHPGSYASVMALLGTGRNILDLDVQEKLYSKLSASVQQLPEAQSIKNFVEGSRGSAIGSIVKDFTLNTPEDKPLPFGSFKGKYVLIDFWASWCVPCKESFPHLREVYKRYKGEQFEVYSISIDKNKAAWLKAVKEERFPWPQSLDTKDISNKGFAVTGVPSTFLIGPDGKILAKEVGFDPGKEGSIEKKLKEVFGSKAAANAKDNDKEFIKPVASTEATKSNNPQ